MEVDQWLYRDLCLDVSFTLCLLQLLDLCVVRVHVGPVVLVVVQLHDLAGDGRLQRTIVVCSMCMSAIRIHYMVNA